MRKNKFKKHKHKLRLLKFINVWLWRGGAHVEKINNSITRHVLPEIMFRHPSLNRCAILPLELPAGMTWLQKKPCSYWIHKDRAVSPFDFSSCWIRLILHIFETEWLVQRSYKLRSEFLIILNWKAHILGFYLKSGYFCKKCALFIL